LGIPGPQNGHIAGLPGAGGRSIFAPNIEQKPMQSRNLPIIVLLLAFAPLFSNARQTEPDRESRARLKAELKAELLDEMRAELGESKAAKAAESGADRPSRLTIGGYGEAVMSRNFYSDNYLRYSNAEKYRDGSHGRFDLPHAVVWLGYDFGRGWSFGTEIEFEHGGTESAVEIEEEEAGEYESEVERGGEVALEQFWIQKSFSPALNLRMGHMVVPVGATNMHHMPDEYFGVCRPEGESTIFPCTWHETGVSLWGTAGRWRYEVMFLPGLDSDRFTSKGWIHDGAGSPYEFKIGTSCAGAFRIDNFSVRGLRLSLSGYCGNSFRNTLYDNGNAKWKDVTGTVAIGCFDFAYDDRNVIVRGSFDYGHLSDSDMITAFNKSMSSSSVSAKQAVASDVVACGIEAGYDFFSLSRRLRESGQRFYLFGRCEFYDSMYRAARSVVPLEWCGRLRVAFGLNYYPIRNIAIKAEYAVGLLKPPYNDEPSLSIGVTYRGVFKR